VPWEDVSYAAEPVEAPEAAEFLRVLGQTHVNGGGLLRILRPHDEAAFDHALRNDFRGVDHALKTLLTRPSVAAGLPELQIPTPLETSPHFDLMSLLGMEGELTQMLLVGGAYERFRGTIDEARALSRRFMEALFGEELHRVGWAAHTSTPWTPWLYDAAWDATFVVQDLRAKRFILLCATDTD
jgi:hypothetical protein